MTGWSNAQLHGARNTEKQHTRFGRRIKMQVKFEESGTPLKRSRNRKGETSEEQLRRMCKNIAEEISAGPQQVDIHTGEDREEVTASSWMEDVYDIRYIVDREKRYLGAEILVAGGGPTVWVDLWDQEVKGYWGADRVCISYVDNLGLDDYCEELYGS